MKPGWIWRQAWPADVPTLFTAFRLMAGIGALLGCCWCWPGAGDRQRASPAGRRTVLWLMACAPLPWVATLSGWVVAEVGRQPWVVYGQLLTADAGLALAPAGGAMAFAARLAGMALLGGLFIAVAAWLWRRGPGPLPWPALTVPGARHAPEWAACTVQEEPPPRPAGRASDNPA
jgi:cytochrome d ubiquinol oxidase subunit I